MPNDYPMKSLLSINYFVWLIVSALFFAMGEFLSKKFALEPKGFWVLLILASYTFGTLAWLPAILQKNQLSIVGTIWSVLSLLATILIGVLLFNEKISLTSGLGIFAALIAIVLLSVG
jgi:multidrug transporter EmrE-like cation transporter